MNNRKFNIHQDERGSAILLTLGILSLLLTMAMVFAITSRNARAVAIAQADGESANLAAESAADRAVSIMYYIGKEGTKPATPQNGYKDLEYNTVPYIGSNDCADVPMLKKGELTRANGGTNPPRQEFFYLFGEADQIRDNAGNLSAGSMLHSAISGTNLVSFFNSTGNYSTALAPGMPGATGTEAIQFRNVLDADGKVTSRYGYMILAEGAKMNINNLVLGGGDTKVPYVKDGEFTTDTPPENRPFADGESVAPIMGYKDDGKIERDVAEDSTIRYGAHPQELRVADEYHDGVNDTNEPAAWYNYDALIANTKNSDDKVQFGADVMRYSVAGGSDDREIRFTGSESPDDIKEGAAALDDLVKTDLSMPAGKTWDDISNDAQTDPDTYLTDTLLEDLGFDGTKEIFKAEDGTTDVTKQVLANMVDFNDDDDYATYHAEVGGGKLKMNTAIDYETTVDTPEEWFCGNEKVPYISAIGLELCEPTGKVTNSTRSYNILFVGSRTVDIWSVPNAADNPQLKMKMRAVLGNIFNEKFTGTTHCRVVVRGRVCIYYKVMARNALDMDQTLTYFADKNYTGETTAPSSLATHTAAWTGLQLKLGLSGGGNVLGTNLYREGNEQDLLNNEQAYTDFTLVWNASTGDFDELTFAQDIVGEAKEIESGRRTVRNGLGKVQSIHTRLLIKDIIVTTADSESADKLYDLAYIKPHSKEQLGDGEFSFTNDSTVMNYDNNVLGTVGGGYLGAHYVTIDPRFNHSNKGWLCGPATDGSTFNDCAENTASEFGVLIPTDPAVADATLNSLMQNNFDMIADECNGDNTQADVDWEPELTFPDTVSGDRVQFDATFSTAYIPNKPVTSLWQLGAIHRGEPGRTINLKKYGDAAEKFKYKAGDAWILDYFCLNQLDSETGTIRGRFNPNCFDKAAYDSILSYLPYIDDVNEATIYDPLASGKDDNMGDQYAEAQAAQTVKLVDFITYKDGSEQSWSPVEAFCNFVELSSAANDKLNDRVAESFVGCTAGLLSTRYEIFTILAAGQKVRYLMSDAEMADAKNDAEYMKSLVNPIQIVQEGTDWYSVLGTRLQLVTVVRDCWFNTYKVVSRQQL